MISFFGVAAKRFRRFAGAFIFCLTLGWLARPGATAEPTEPELPAVDLATARTLLLSQVPQVPWLLRETPRPIGATDLASLVPAPPTGAAATIAINEANSDQRQPLHLGASQRDQIIYGKSAPIPRLPSPLRALVEHQALWVADHLEGNIEGHVAKKGARSLELEVWPTENDVGRLTWVISRYRRSKDTAWHWLDAAAQRDDVTDPDLAHEPTAILPEHLSPASRRGYIAIFRDFFAADSRDLYEKPRFSQCIWLNADKSATLAAWRPSIERPAQRLYFEHASEAERREAWCVALPMPPRFNQKPMTLHLRIIEPGADKAQTLPKVQFVEPVEWVTPPAEHPLSLAVRQAMRQAKVPSFPPSFDVDYRRDLAMLSGVTPLDATGPGAPAGIRLVRKNSADPRNQLDLLVDYLEARYKRLGLATRRQRFTFRAIPESNLVAILPSKQPAGTPPKPPIVLVDHIDTAFCEDVFARSEQRISAPGADDNATATAALLRAAEVLSAMPAEARQHEIWLLHLTGEEFPGDDLGARHFLAELLHKHVDLGAMLLLDMIGHNPRHRPEYQINTGGYFEAGNTSMRIAQLSALITPRAAPALRAVIYPQTDLRSYLYNTDGLIFAEAGFPVLHFSEVMNRYLLTRSGYHDSFDTLETVNIAHAAAVSRVAIATAAVLSQMGLPPAL